MLKVEEEATEVDVTNKSSTKLHEFWSQEPPSPGLNINTSIGKQGRFPVLAATINNTIYSVLMDTRSSPPLIRPTRVGENKTGLYIVAH
ncbi:hypothetical protein J6590_050274 [Homalodisca vitripennis]|nr:hypothetical protein J6590_050274 [Homalodisca vitripennis]